MSGKKLLALLVAISAVGVLGLAGNAYAARLRTGATRYVRVVRLRHGQLVLRLTRAGRTRFGVEVRGKFLVAQCVRLRRTAAGLISAGTTTSLGTIPGPGGRPVDVSFVDPRADFCDVGLGVVKKTRHGIIDHFLQRPALDNVPLTERGAGYLNEDRIAVRLLFTIDLAEASAAQHRSGHFPPAHLLGKLPGTVALRTAKATPPAHKVGYFSDDSEHAEVVAVSALGQRLFIDIDHGTFSTNAEDHIARVLRGQLALAEYPALPQPTPVKRTS